MATVDPTAAFDLVNIELLFKRLRIIGHLSDVIEQFLYWPHWCWDGPRISLRSNSLLTLWVASAWPCTNHTIRRPQRCPVWHIHRAQLIIVMETKLVIITNWVRDSGLKVNESKTDLCLFHQKDQPQSGLHWTTNQLLAKIIWTSLVCPLIQN